MTNDELRTQVVLCIGAHWPFDFVPEDDLCEAVNEFLRLPRPEAFLDLIKHRKLFLQVSETKQDGCWLSFKLAT